jgi:hypothetical protein
MFLLEIGPALPVGSTGPTRETEILGGRSSGRSGGQFRPEDPEEFRPRNSGIDLLEKVSDIVGPVEDLNSVPNRPDEQVLTFPPFHGLNVDIEHPGHLASGQKTFFLGPVGNSVSLDGGVYGHDLLPISHVYKSHCTTAEDLLGVGSKV